MDNRVNSIVSDWAKAGNNADVPEAKIPSLNASIIVEGQFNTNRLADEAVTFAKWADGTPNKYIRFNASGRPIEVDLPSAGIQIGAVHTWARSTNNNALPPEKIPGLDAAKTTTGVFHIDRIPDMDADKITSGTFDLDRLPTIPNNKLQSPYTDALADARILSWARTGNTDTVPLDKLPQIPNSKLIGALTQADVDARISCLLYTSPSPRDRQKSRMPSSA